MAIQKKKIKNTKKEFPRLTEDVVIVLQRAFGVDDIWYKLTIHGNGDVIYDGNSKTIGTREAKISKGKVKELINEFYKKNFFTLKNSYDPTGKYLKATLTAIKINGKIKAVRNQSSFKRIKNLDELNDMIDKITESERWVWYASEKKWKDAKNELQKRMKERKKIKVDKNVVITLERGSYWARFPGSTLLYKITIYGDGNIVYEGGADVKTIGIKKSKISKETIEKLLEEFYKTDFFSLKENYNLLRGLVSFESTSIKIGNKLKKVFASGLTGSGINSAVAVMAMGEPERLSYLNNKIEEITNSYRWTGWGKKTGWAKFAGWEKE